MSEASGQPDVKESTRRWGQWGLNGLLGAVTILTLTVMAIAYFFYYPSQVGPVQPIPFSHRFHVTQKKISCILCHAGAIDTARAGVPPLETCMLCHQRIAIAYPWIARLREHYFSDTPVQWARVNELPEFVYFSHERHVRRAVDCGHCHGNVAQMDRISQVHPFKMGWCVQCHRDNAVSHDCLICHR